MWCGGGGCLCSFRRVRCACVHAVLRPFFVFFWRVFRPSRAPPSPHIKIPTGEKKYFFENFEKNQKVNILKTGEKNSMWRASGGAETPSLVPVSSVHSSSLLSCAPFWLGHRFRKFQKVARAHFTSFPSRPPMPIPRKSKTFNLAPRGVGAKFSVWHPPGSKHRAKQTPRAPAFTKRPARDSR